MVEVRAVQYHAGKVRILENVSASFRANRFNVILGPNGAGKSTLLKIATGLLRPSSGEVRYAGRPLAAYPPDELARTRAVLSQHVELAFALPVADVVLMGRYPHYRRVPSARDRQIVDRAIEMVGMEEKRAQPYPTLSGGEQQKVQLARVLAQIWNYDTPEQHKVLFLDEPTSSLDVHYQIHLLGIAKELLAYDCTVVAILHDLNVALQYGDSFFVIAEGRMVLETDRSSDISAELLERVFRVQAHAVTDPESGDRFWRFGL